MKVELKNVASVFNGKTPSKAEQRDVGFPVLKIKDIDENGFFKGQFDCFVDQKLADGLLKKHVHVGDILILNAAHNSKYVGSKKCFVSEDFAGALATGEWTIVRSNQNKVLPKFIFFILDTDEFQFELQNVIKGIHLYPKDLNEIKIFCPSLEEQKRIVRILDQADSLRQKRQKAISLLDDYLKAVFLEMFGDPVTNPKGWEKKTIEQIAKTEKHSIKRGPFGGALKKEIFVDDGYLVYEQFHALNNDFSMARYFIDEKKFQELKAFEVKAGDIIISCSGVYLGKLAIVPANCRKGIINQALLKVSLNKAIMKNILFTHIFTNENFKNKFFGKKIGSGIPNFPPMTAFKKFEFMCPPIELQEKFEAIAYKTESLTQSMLSQSEELNANFNALMQEYFKPKSANA